MKLTIKQAAAYLNISEITVRRRIKKGDLTAIKEETPQGFVWLIDLAEVRETDQPADHVDCAATTQLPDQRLITELEDQVSWLRHELEDRKREHDRDRDDWRNEIERLHTLMAQQGQTLQALSATVQEAASEASELPERENTPERSTFDAPESSQHNETGLQGIRAWLRRLLGD